MVSTPRGAIKKRNGSLVFAAAAAGVSTFPTLAVTDSFKRPAEKPLAKDGKGHEAAWEVFGPGVATTGEINGAEQWVKTAGKNQALYNVKEETNPAVSVEVSVVPPAGGQLNIWIAQKALVYEGYFLSLIVKASSLEVGLFKYAPAGKITQIGVTVTVGAMEAKDQYGITLRNETLTSWRKRAGTWTRLVEGTDSSYTKGYGAFEASSTTALNNFAVGETNEGAAVLNSEVTSLAAVTIGTTPYLIGAAGTKLFSVNASGEVSVISGAKAFTEGKRWSIIQAEEGTREAGQGPIYLSNGTDAPQYWKGTAKNTEVVEWKGKAEGEFNAVPKAKYLVYFAEHVWAAGIAGDTSALRWSGKVAKGTEGEIPDPTSWPKANVVWFDKEDGQEITGLGIQGPYLLVFKQHKVWTVFDLSEGENRRISDTSGAIAWRSIQETPMGTFYLTPDQGVFLTNGAKVQELSRNVRPLLQGQDPISGREDRAAKLNELENAAAGYLNGHYYLSYMAQDGTMKTLDYDTQLKSWWLQDIASNQWVHWEPVTGEAFLYSAPRKAKAGIVKAFIPTVFQDSGKNYTGREYTVREKNEVTAKKTLTSYWASCHEPFWQYFMRHRFQQPQIKKRIRTLFVDAGRGTSEVEAYAWRNFKELPQRLKGTVENQDIATESTYTPKTGVAEAEYNAIRFYSLGTGRVWSFMFGNATAEPWEVTTYAADLYFRKN